MIAILTGAANRRGLQEWWRDKISEDYQPHLAFLMIDLDDFKPINDRYGHQAGDTVLCTIANRLKALKIAGLVCRLGGDEFGVITVSENREHIAELCQRIAAIVQEPIQISGAVVCVSASIGGCLYPDQANDKRELLKKADDALYMIKKTGKGRWGWWKPEI